MYFLCEARQMRAADPIRVEDNKEVSMKFRNSLLEEKFMSTESNSRMHLSRTLVRVFFGLALLSTAAVAVAAPCTGPGAPSTTQTKCLTAILLPGQLKSFDISFVNPKRDEYYLADRSNKGVDIIDINKLKFVRTAGLDKPFQGIVLNPNNTVNNAASGPAGVVAHGRWLYAGDGDSTVHVIDLESPA